MASLDFPSNPTNGQTYALNGVTYYYNSTIGAWLTQQSTSNLSTSSNTQVLFNDAGVANGSTGLSYNKFANTLSANTINVNNFTAAVFKLLSSGGGSVSLDVPSTGGTFTLTAPAITGNVITSADSNTVTQSMINRAGFYGGFGPSFAAYNSVATSIVGNGNWTKPGMQTEEWDTANCFDSTTNYRFTPNVAGYYHFSGAVQLLAAAVLCVSIWKNGGEYRRGIYTSPTTMYGASVSGIVYMNGSSDYVELYCYNGSVTSYNSQIGNAYTYFNGFLARPA